MAPIPKRRPFRSQQWFGRLDRQGFEHRSFMRGLSLPEHVFDGRPVIGICSMWSELNPCDAGHRDLAQQARLGVTEAGGLPLEFPSLAIGEPLMRPSPMMFRNLAAMALEELVRANPLDGLVLLAGCDKTTPALLMGAASADLPSVLVSSGPKINSRFKGEVIGSGTHIWQVENALAMGMITQGDRIESEIAMSRSFGTCMTMGTASTMAALAEAMGIALEHNCCIPAPDVRRGILARQAGAVAVEAVHADRRPSQIMTRAAFENAVRVVAAIGGSTNAVLHLQALAQRLKVEFSLDDWNVLGDQVPCIVDLMPSGRFLMDDFYAAGGLSVVLARLAERGLLHADAPTISGPSLGERLARAHCFDNQVIRSFQDPVSESGGLVVLRGTLAPDGAVLKPSAATHSLLRHRGRAIVFDSLEEFKCQIDDPSKEIVETDILVLRNCGPRGYPGMPEAGNMKLPDRLVKQGVRDMVRVSDARMSGTAFGTVILHVAPEAAVGGPLALVRTGDFIVVDVAARRLDLDVSDDELQSRRKGLAPPSPPVGRGYQRLYAEHVLQANQGADFDFLLGADPVGVPRDSS
jgi:L-arabonate dehydrase